MVTDVLVREPGLRIKRKIRFFEMVIRIIYKGYKIVIGRTAKVSAKVLVRRVLVFVLVVVLIGVVRGCWPIRHFGRVTRPSHSAAEIRICNTQQPLSTLHSTFLKLFKKLPDHYLFCTCLSNHCFIFNQLISESNLRL